MIKGSYEIYNIDPMGNKTLFLENTNDLVPSTWEMPVTGVDGLMDIKLFKDFGKATDLRIVLSETRVIRAFDRDIENLRANVATIDNEITEIEASKSLIQSELDSLLQEIETLKQEIIDSETLINAGRDTITRLKSEIPNDKRNIQSKNDDINRILKNKELLENDIRNHRKSIETLEAKRENLLYDIQSYKNQIKRRSDQLKNNADIQSLYHQITQYQNTIKEIESQIGLKENEISIAEDEFVKLRDVWIQKSTDEAPDVDQAKLEMDSKRDSINSLKQELENLKGDIKRNEGFIDNLDLRIIDKTIELDPTLDAIKERYEDKQIEVQSVEETIENTKSEISTAENGISASEENKRIAEGELNELIKIVQDKEELLKNTTADIQNAQIVIVSNTNAIPLKESEIPKKRSAIEEINIVLNDKNNTKNEIQSRISEIEITRNAREANIENVSMVNYTPFEFRSDIDSFPDILSWKSQNLTNEELLELKRLAVTSSRVLGGFPCVIEHTFSDGSKLYGQWFSSLQELPDAHLEFEYPSDVRVTRANYISSISDGTFRNYQGEKLQESDDVPVYRRIFHISRILNEPGSYTFVGVTYENKLLSLSKISRDDDITNQLIINAGHKIEINYMYNFLSKEDRDFNYTININGIDTICHVSYNQNSFTSDLQKNRFYIGQVTKLADALFKRYTISNTTYSDGTGNYVKSSVDKEFLILRHNKAKNNPNNLYEIDDTIHKLKSIEFNVSYNDGVTESSVNNYITVSFEPEIEINHVSMRIPMPFYKDLYSIGFLNYESYRGREFDYYNQSGIGKSFIELDNLIETNSTDKIKIPYIDNIKKVTTRLW